MLTMHGGAYLAVKTEEPIADRARIAGFVAALLLIALFVGGGVWVALARRLSASLSALRPTALPTRSARR